ncbi:hypothetical protein KRP22_007326 [Phytophthora ramorum]|nr:hypothetical protein KRP22_4663 [Phytophthora ramorum]
MDSRRTAPDRTTPVRVLRVVDLARGHLGHRQSIGCLRGHADNFAQRLLDAQLCKLMLTFHLHGCRATTQHESRRQQQVEGVHRRGMRWTRRQQSDESFHLCRPRSTASALRVQQAIPSQNMLQNSPAAVYLHIA